MYKLRFITIAFLVTIIFFSCSRPEPRKPVVRKSSTFLKEFIVRNKAINKLEEAVLKDLMLKDTMHVYSASENGFWYYYNTKDSLDGYTPKSGDEVFFNYAVKDVDGNTLYTEEEIGPQSYLVDKQDIITGLQDGIKLMKEGETVTFLFPSYKAYGYLGHERIARGQPLIYTVKLNKIIVNNK
ncbi:MAG: gliding motility-associated peptidyl-prolyl isomerase GldI [Flavobacteriaceae bacterium]|nr:gliding motility-associated peptidyl-prolyl isomerase GldI [Flavobacteriaceae bacterium]